METTRLSVKGQVVIPKGTRLAKGWKSGDVLIVEERPEGILLRRQKTLPTTTLDQVVGSGGYSGPVISVEQMAEAVAGMFAADAKRRLK